jgi:four helix bundle protein
MPKGAAAAQCLHSLKICQIKLEADGWHWRPSYGVSMERKPFSILASIALSVCARRATSSLVVGTGRRAVRSAGSIAANYLEANENLGEKDLKMRIKICRKESKESQLWLKHILIYEIEILNTERKILLQEASELEKIFGAILRKLN